VRGRFTSTRTSAAEDRITTRITSIEPTLSIGGSANLRVFGEYRHEGAGGPLATRFTTRDRDGNLTNDATTVAVSVPPARREGWAGGLSAWHALSQIR